MAGAHQEQAVSLGDARLPPRFWAKVAVDNETGCWLWTAGYRRGGYARFRYAGAGSKNGAAHRFSYEKLIGPVSGGLQLDHLCRVRHCVNPAHLEPVTPRENTLRGNTLRGSKRRQNALPGWAPL